MFRPEPQNFSSGPRALWPLTRGSAPGLSRALARVRPRRPRGLIRQTPGPTYYISTLVCHRGLRVRTHVVAHMGLRTTSPQNPGLPSIVPFSFFLNELIPYIYSMKINPHTHLEERGSDHFAVVTDIRGVQHSIKVNLDDIILWKSGELIQRAMPYLTPDQRELLISGIPGDMYDRMFNDDDRI